MTLIEILVLMGIIVLLGALLFPTFLGTVERTRSIQCLGHLREAGNTLLIALRERKEGPVFRPWYSGNSGEFWNTWLVSHKYLTYEDLRRLSCPSIGYPSNIVTGISGKHYGIYMGDTNNLMAYYDDKGNKIANGYQINVMTQDRPASTIFMADSVANGEQTIRIFKSDSGNFTSGAIHARHQGSANLFFLDGHTETAGAERLYELGVRRVFTNNSSAEPEAYTLPKPIP